MCNSADEKLAHTHMRANTARFNYDTARANNSRQGALPIAAVVLCDFRLSTTTLIATGRVSSGNPGERGTAQSFCEIQLLR